MQPRIKNEGQGNSVFKNTECRPNSVSTLIGTAGEHQHLPTYRGPLNTDVAGNDGVSLPPTEAELLRRKGKVFLMA